MSESRTPAKGSGGFGTASTFGSLDGWTLEEADEYLNSHPELRRRSVSAGEYRHYQFKDGSELIIRPSGEIVRLPHPMYRADGGRIRGIRLSTTGQILWSADWHKLPRSEKEWVVTDDSTN